VNTPIEILYWSADDINKFVKSMKDGRIRAYSGRGMVIGCAEAGKTTLVKKLRKDKDLETQPTKGIEIHTHVFKLDEEELTIIGTFKNFSVTSKFYPPKISNFSFFSF
jgi:GTPase SAR1 family protein